MRRRNKKRLTSLRESLEFILVALHNIQLDPIFWTLSLVHLATKWLASQTIRSHRCP